MIYELCKKLKNAGFPQKDGTHIHSHNFTGCVGWSADENDEMIMTGCDAIHCEKLVYSPTLSELIEACGDGFAYLFKGYEHPMWYAGKDRRMQDLLTEGQGSTPEEAVANLWLKLNKKHD